jgi:hypothetical protein
MNKTLATITIAIVLFTVPTLSAQSKKKGKASEPAPLDVSVSRIEDRRTTSYFSQLTVGLELSGFPAADVTAARVVVKAAVDDVGTDLIGPDPGEARFEPTSFRIIEEGDRKTPASVELVLGNPSRDAVALKEVRGEIELFMPGKDPAAVVVVPKFQSLVGKPIASRELKASGVEIAMISSEQLEAEKKKGAKARADELKAEGMDQESIDYYVQSFEEYFFTPEEGEIVLKINDPDGRVHELAYVDPAGETQRAYTREQDGMTVLSTFGEPLDANTSLKISVRTAKTLARHTFVVRDVALP